ncbi:Ssu72-like RNA polymerase II-interacting protein [Hamiltosporidium tvaerminnensis]|uniref:RNA polymerase II subunit A C-terminal domain phosphatase SSU72 n=1 Tax=Hamiltosporidium tvaerminnensis TaxID=1176355 RepID=A0A4Q9M3P1_9MICR|nr:Ssu72-like RNA polymerase II-interacting protein [Hamiltosporidium tvaerminnensis]
MPTFLNMAVCCAMNQNRSMEAHGLLQKKGFKVSSYGTSNNIKLPGMSITQPNIYSFNTTYREIYNDLREKNENFYRNTGLLHLLQRNISLKEKPESFFEVERAFDLVITCEERCFVFIFEYYGRKEYLNDYSDGVFYLVNFDIKDTPSDAILGANEILQFVKIIEDCNLDIDTAIEKFCEIKKCTLLYTVLNK